jgi:hypothetical protein
VVRQEGPHVTALRAYRALPAASGVWFLVVALLGRLPSAMSQIGSLLLVSHTTGSLAAGGATAATLALGQAIGGPVVGRLADRTGHRTVGAVIAVLQVIAIVGLVALANADAPLPAVLASGFVVGLTVPQIGPLARARWSGLIACGRAPASAFGTAMSYEGAVDETTYVLGPALVGIVVAVYSAQAAMLLAAALTAVFALAFALHPTASLVPHREDTADGTLARKRDVPSLLLLSLILLCVGCFFASVQAGVTSIAIAAGTEGSAGIIYGVMGLTSATAGLLTPVLPARFRLPARLTTFLCLLLLFVIPLVTIGAAGSLSLVALGFAVALAGVAVAPSLITAFSLGERTVPPAQVSWAMTMLSSGIVLGYAIAALTAGILAQQHGAIGAFCVTFGAVAVAVVLSVLGRRRFTALMARETSPGKLVST